MTLSKKAKLLAKIAKMMEMARRTDGNEEEAAVAARMVEGLLRKHNLTISDITPEQAKSECGQAAYSKMKWTAGKTPTWVMALAIAIGTTYETHVVYSQAAGNDSHVAKTQLHISFVGLEVDVAVSLDMFAYLYSVVIRATDTHFKVSPAPTGKARTYKAAYRDGMASRLRGRLADLVKEREAEATETGTALVIVKENAIAEYLGRKPTYSKSTRKVAGNSEAYAAGHAKGGDVSMNKQVK